MSITNTTGFASLGLPSSLLRQLESAGFVQPTPIQAEAIPPGMDGKDVLGIAQTGTGKTLAFGLPMAARLKSHQVGLVLAPTRELAQQIQETFQLLRLKTALLIGGAPMGPQNQQLRARPQVIVATPGRLLDHMGQGSVDLRFVTMLVLDEADRMLDMGFAPAIQRILAATPRTRQTSLFSATMPREIETLARDCQRDPVRVEIERQGTAAHTVEHELVVVDKEEKKDMLRELLHENRGSVLVFSRTRHGARSLAKAARAHGHAVAELHSDRTLPQRKAALAGFKQGEYRVLVATDIAARGIDVKEISLVINYDIPQCAEDYVHRIGRTGRAGHQGRAITLASPDQHADVRDIEKLIDMQLPRSPKSRIHMDTAPKPVNRTSRRRRR